MMRSTVFLSPVKYLIDAVAVIAVALLALLLGRRTPGDDVWNYMNGLLFLAGIVLTIGGAYVILWAAELIVHEPKAIKEKSDLSNASAIITTLGLLGAMFIGACAILALYMRWTTNLVTGILHLVHLPITVQVDQLIAERSGIAALIVVLIVIVFIWTPAWIQAGTTHLRGAHGRPGDNSADGTASSGGEPCAHPVPPHYSDDSTGVGSGTFFENVLQGEEPGI